MTNRNSWTLRAALIYIAATALVVIGVQPILVGLYSERLYLDLSQQGWILSSDMAGTLLGSLLLPSLERRFGGRSLFIGVALATACSNAASAISDSYSTLIGCRCACGFGAGLLYAGAINALGRLPGQDRSYGLSLLLQTLVFALFAATLPVLAAGFGSNLASASICIWFLLIALVSIVIPSRLRSDEPANCKASGLGSARTGRFALLGMLCLQVAIYCIWGFIDQLGRERGITAIDIGWAFGIGILGGLPGAALPSMLGGRVSRGPMIGFGSLLVLLSIIILDSYTSTGRQLCAALFLMNFGWVLALAYYMSSISTNDPQGSLTPLVSVVQSGAATLAPALIALLLQHTAHEVIFLTSGLAVVSGFILKSTAELSVRRSTTEG